MDRRGARYALREELRDVTTVARARYCGRRRARRELAPEVRVRQDAGRTVAHFAHLQLCGLPWVCPVCGPRVRQERARELDGALSRWIERHGAGSVLLLTLTVPHIAHEHLAELLSFVRDGFSSLTSGRAWQELKRDFGLAGYVRAHDCTHGANGWHPHLHVVVLAGAPVTPDAAERLHARVFHLWRNAVVRQGHRAPDARALSVEVARRREDVSRYVMQVVAGDRERPATVALEVARGDLKTGKRDGQRTPWELLQGATRRVCDGDGVLDEHAEAARERDRTLWREWEQATKGTHAVQWSRGLRALAGLSVEAPTDEEIVSAEVGGETVYTFTDAGAWLAVCDTRGAQCRVLRAAERHGARGCARMVSSVVRHWQRRRRRYLRRDAARGARPWSTPGEHEPGS